MLKALAVSHGFAYIAHSPTFSALLLPAAAAVVAAEAGYLIHLMRRDRKKARL